MTIASVAPVRTALRDYQTHVADTVRGVGDHRTDLRGGAVVRWAVGQWALTQLRGVCPLTTALLEHDDRLEAALALHLARPGRTGEMHLWGLAFLVGLFDDTDPLVADVARLEHAMTAPVTGALRLPHPWVWRRSPERVVLALVCGADPREVPVLRRPVAVRRDAGGHLTVDPVDEPAPTR